MKNEIERFRHLLGASYRDKIHFLGFPSEHPPAPHWQGVGYGLAFDGMPPLPVSPAFRWPIAGPGRNR